MSRTREVVARGGWIAIPIAIASAIFATRACATDAQFDRLARVTAPIAGDPPGSVVYTGSIDVTRAGPVIFGMQVDGPARLTVGTAEIRGSAGVVKSREIVPAGALAIRVAAHPSAHVRLVWNPVGRRGDPEYTPASSLSPNPPATATFGSFPGAAPLDGVFALALLVTLVGSIMYAARARLRAVPRDVWIAFGAVVLVALAARLWDLGGMGQTWDEDVNWGSGRNYVTNLLALDGSKRSWIWNYEHPPVMKLLDGIGAQFADGMGPARAMSAVISALGCAFLVPIGTRLYSLRAGIFAAMIAALLPQLVGHGQIVGHESPTLLWWTLGVCVALGAHDGLETLTTRRLALRLGCAGAIVGIAVGSRFVNGLLGPLLVAIVLLRTPPSWRWRTIAIALALMPVIAWITFQALWPRLWGDFPAALKESLSKLDTQHPAEPFLGAMTNKPAIHYFVTYLFATMPGGLVVGIAAWGVRVARERKFISAITLALFFIVPLGVTFSPVRQDGIRYVMPSVAALALIAGIGFDYTATFAKRYVVEGLVGVYMIITLARIHPYGIDYFGELVGGPGVVESRRWFETAWWGEGLGEALAYVNEHAEPNALVHRDCIVPAHLAWFRGDLWSPVHDPAKATWIVSYAPATTPCKIPTDATLVFSVDAGGAVLANVWHRK